MVLISPRDCQGAFEDVLEVAAEGFGTRLTAYCIMPNHWHLVLWPLGDRELSAFVRWVTLTLTQRWHAAHESAGTGHLYQGRFKSFPVAADEHYLMLCRYVERNGLRARLVRKAENWRWGSAWRRYHADAGKEARAWLAAGPVELPRNWRAVINTPQSEAELAEVRTSVQRGRPMGEEKWQARMVAAFGLEATVRPRGRPKKGE